MDEIIEVKETLPIDGSSELGLVQISESILLDAQMDISAHSSISMPIAQLSTLGTGVSSILPALKTITQSTTINAQGLYRLANAGAGDVLKVAKNGNFWGAMKTADGASKMVQLQAAGPLSAASEAARLINPTTMMMAVALFSIEKELGNIAEMERQILSFLQIEKESEIEADIKMLSNMVTQYKYNWNNEHFIASNHKMVLDIQRTARKNMFAYQKGVAEMINKGKLLVAQNMVNTIKADLIKKFKYYRLSLYAFSLASLLEIMLSGNFTEENIHGIKREIEENTVTYMEMYSDCSRYLEKLTHSSVETNALKGLGIASNAVGKMIGKIPVVEKGTVDEFLQDSGEHFRVSAKGIERDTITTFAEISNPATRMFIDKMNDMIQIYNHTDKICFDNERIYLVND